MPDRQAHIAALRLPLDQLPDPLPIPVIERAFDVSIRPPGSKSITNRALLLAALAYGVSTIRGALIDAEDAQVMIKALEQLGARIDFQLDGSLRISGVSGEWKIPHGETVTLKLGNAGTATRFLAAAALLAPIGTHIEIDGDRRMRERPIGQLVEALSVLAWGMQETETVYTHREGFPPIRVPGQGNRNPASPGYARFGRTESSQFISAVLLIGPFLSSGLRVEFEDAITSESYVSMTIELLKRCGIPVIDKRPAFVHVGTLEKHDDDRVYREHAPTIHALDLDIEPDASGASYFEAAAALFSNAKITVQGLDLGPKGSLQGDTHFVSVLTAAGARVERLNNALRITGPSAIKPIDFDLSDMPDTAMTAAAIACFASPPHPTPDNPTATTTLRGLRTLRVKETDRLAALQTELSKLGAKVEIFQDGDDEGLRITPPPPSALGPAPSPLFFDTYNDHRMAMALALIGLRRPNVFIRNPACVAKTYPTFWQDLARLYEPRTQ